ILKMDRTFLADLHRQGNSGPVIQAVVGLAHALGMDVVAEGVEIEGPRAALLELGCGFGQAFLFGRPAEFADQAAPALPACAPALDGPDHLARSRLQPPP